MTDMGVNSLMLREIARDRAQERNSLQKVLSLKLFLAPVYILAVFSLPGVLSGHDSHIVFLDYPLCRLHGGQRMRRVHHHRLEGARTVRSRRDRQPCQRSDTFAASHSCHPVRFRIDRPDCRHTASYLADFGYRLGVLLSAAESSPWPFRFARDYFRQLRASSPFAMYMLVNPLFMQIDLVMLGWMSLLSSVGVFNAGYRIDFVPLFYPERPPAAVVSTVVAPILIIAG